jgi:hypothetical protein
VPFEPGQESLAISIQLILEEVSVGQGFCHKNPGQEDSHWCREKKPGVEKRDISEMLSCNMLPPGNGHADSFQGDSLCGLFVFQRQS